MMNQTDENLLNGYIAGTLSRDEIQLLNAKMENNPEIRERVRIADSLEAPLNDWQSLQLRKKLFDIYQSDTNRPAGVWSYATAKWQRLTVVAALFLITMGVALALIFSETQSKDPYGKYYQPAKPFLMQRSAEPSSASDFGAAMQFYKKTDYVNAARLLASQTDNMAARFYLAISMMELNDFSKAIDHLEAVSADKSNLFTDQAMWYLALCYVKTGNEPMAINVLKTISSSQSYFNDKAVDMLSELE